MKPWVQLVEELTEKARIQLEAGDKLRDVVSFVALEACVWQTAQQDYYEQKGEK